MIEARGLVKRFGRVAALAGCDLDLRAGEILAVIGDNGAGKSTLIQLLAGALRPDAGRISIGGRPVRFRSPLEARRAGIETVYQDLALVPALTIAENLYLGRELLRPGPLAQLLGLLDRPRMQRESRRLLEALQVEIGSMRQPVESLSGGQRQCVAVARAAAFARHVVILDEPTAALGVRESGMVLELMRRVRAQGLSVLLVSHNMPQVFAVADRIHVARLGRRAAVLDPRSVSMNDAVAVMTGALPAERLPEEWLA